MEKASKAPNKMERLQSRWEDTKADGKLQSRGERHKADGKAQTGGTWEFSNTLKGNRSI